MKMLKVFSNQMRRIHTQVSSLMETEDVKPDEGLFNVGEYYLKNKRFSQAKYVFGRYLTYYPSGKNALQASKNLEAAENSLANFGGGKSPPVSPVSSLHPLAAKPAAADATGTAKDYYDAVSLISQEKYVEAFGAFKRIIDANTDPEWAARSSYEIGRCLFLLGKFDECVKHYTVMLTKYPRHPDLRDAIFYIGQCNERTGRKEQAAAFYKKIIAMPADEGDGTTVKAKRALKALGG
jgi:TolA-binding protein